MAHAFFFFTQDLWDLSFVTRYQISNPRPLRWKLKSFNHWTARVILGRFILSQGPQSISQMGSPRDEQGLSGSHSNSTSLFQYLKEATSEWEQEGWRVRPAPMSLSLKEREVPTRPLCASFHASYTLVSTAHQARASHTWRLFGQSSKSVGKASSVCRAGSKGAVGREPDLSCILFLPILQMGIVRSAFPKEVARAAQGGQHPLQSLSRC